MVKKQVAVFLGRLISTLWLHLEIHSTAPTGRSRTRKTLCKLQEIKCIIDSVFSKCEAVVYAVVYIFVTSAWILQ